jgi:hypothetical protein
MTNRPINSHRLGKPEQGLVIGEQQDCQPADRHYRQLEQKYHHSPQYAAMVSQYPVLRHSIEICHQPELVGSKPDLLSSGLEASWVNWACQL